MFQAAHSLTQLATGYWPAATLIAAVHLRVFDAISERPLSAGGVAERLGVSADRLEALLDALVAMALLSKTADRTYGIAAGYQAVLSRSSPACMLDALAYNADLYQQWANLAGVIRGEVEPAGQQQLGQDPAMTRRFVLGMEAKARAFAPAMVDQIDLTGAATLLDVGSGPGTLTRLLLEKHPALHATLLDLPPVIEVAKEICHSSPVWSRLAFHPADYRQAALPRPFDAAIYAGALHQETAESATALFTKLRGILSPGGRLFVIDLMLDDGRTSPAFSAMFQLNMMLLRPGARVFEAHEVVRLLTAAGFDAEITETNSESPYRVVHGRAI